MWGARRRVKASLGLLHEQYEEAGLSYWVAAAASIREKRGPSNGSAQPPILGLLFNHPGYHLSLKCCPRATKNRGDAAYTNCSTNSVNFPLKKSRGECLGTLRVSEDRENPQAQYIFCEVLWRHSIRRNDSFWVETGIGVGGD